MTAPLAVPLVVGEAGAAEASAVVGALRRRGFDLRRRVFEAFVVDFAGRRESAYAALQSVRHSDWDSALYGDSTGWVLRLSRSRRLAPETVLADLAEVKALATRFGGHVRGLTVEDLRTDDVWGEMAARLLHETRRQDDAAVIRGVPAPRTDAAEAPVQR